MPDLFEQSKTEAPTPRRREKARQKGQVAKSNDLSSGAVVLCTLVLLWFAGRWLGGKLADVVRLDLTFLRSADIDATWLTQIALDHAMQMSGILFPVVLCAAAVSLGVGLSQSGFALSAELLTPDVSRLSPAKGMQRFASMQAVVRGGFDVLKLVGIGTIVWMFVQANAAELCRIDQTSLAEAVANAWILVLELALRIAGLLLLLGLADYTYQWWRNEQGLKMSRQELKEEQKEELGDPAIRNRIKRLQREARKRKMLANVPGATFVLTNPTHLAVAIRYDRDGDAAPVVVAKGAQFLAKTIVRIAREHNIPVLERKPLAQALYKMVEVDQEIPVDLYRAVAQILAYIYRRSDAA